MLMIPNNFQRRKLAYWMYDILLYRWYPLYEQTDGIPYTMPLIKWTMSFQRVNPLEA